MTAGDGAEQLPERTRPPGDGASQLDTATGAADHNRLGPIDLASRRLGGGVLAASDETFAAKENLLATGRPAFTPATFGPRGQLYDGWETRRRRGPGHDWALVRLGAPGLVAAIEVDTAFFTGNHPQACQLDGCYAHGYPDPTELLADGAAWTALTPPSPVRGDADNSYPVDGPGGLVSHVRLTIHPDGGVARLRVLGEVCPDPRRLLGLSVDLAAAENGGRVTDCSDRFYSPPDNLLLPGRAVTMGEGWETRRRRDGGNDWLVVRLAGAGQIRRVIIDTTHFVGNAPAAVRLLGWDATGSDQPAGAAVPTDAGRWVELLGRTRLQPDTTHWFDTDRRPPVTHVRLDAYPDGGLARLRLLGEFTPASRDRLARRWWEALPAPAAAALLRSAGVGAAEAARLAEDRPDAGLPAALRPKLVG